MKKNVFEKKIKIAINGFGRIGRLFFRSCLRKKQIKVVAIQDRSMPIDQIVYLLKHDSIQGTFKKRIKISEDGNYIEINKKTFAILSEKEKEPNYPWKKFDIDYVIDCTHLPTKESLEKHLQDGAKRVIAGESQDENVPIFLFGVNHRKYKGEKIISTGSGGVNCLGVITKILDHSFGFEEGMFTAIRSYNHENNVIDSPHKDFHNEVRMGRCSLNNIIPRKSNEGKLVIAANSKLKGKLTGFSLFVPTPNTCVLDLTLRLKKPISKDELIDELKRSSNSPKWCNIFECNEDYVTSCDFIGCPKSCVFDQTSCIEIKGGNCYKLACWYDSDSSLANRLIDIIIQCSRIPYKMEEEDIQNTEKEKKKKNSGEKKEKEPSDFDDGIEEDDEKSTYNFIFFLKVFVYIVVISYFAKIFFF